MDFDAQCSICMRVFLEPQISGQCPHSFCEPCLRKLMESAGSNLPPCPLCREPIRTQRLNRELEQAVLAHHRDAYLDRVQEDHEVDKTNERNEKLKKIDLQWQANWNTSQSNWTLWQEIFTYRSFFAFFISATVTIIFIACGVHKYLVILLIMLLIPFAATDDVPRVLFIDKVCRFLCAMFTAMQFPMETFTPVQGVISYLTAWALLALHLLVVAFDWTLFGY